MKKLFIPLIASLAILSNTGCSEKKKDKTAQNAILILAASQSSSNLRTSLGGKKPNSTSETGYGSCELTSPSGYYKNYCQYYSTARDCATLYAAIDPDGKEKYGTVYYYSRSTTSLPNDGSSATAALANDKTTCNKLGYTSCDTVLTAGMAASSCIKP